jgi:16S rRNA (cytosine967-C5)-methyltransferase
LTFLICHIFHKKWQTYLFYLAPVNRYYSYLNSAKEILELYKGEEPFAAFLKQFFARRKKYGSKDRKQISHLCYCYFRLGKAGYTLPMEERVLTALFLCSETANELLQNLKPTWNVKINASLKEKFTWLNTHSVGKEISINEVFPWKEELSSGIAYKEFCESFFKQPDLFLRLRPGKEKGVIEKLETTGINFEQVGSNCLALSNSSKLEIIELNKEAVVQDYNSQRVGDLLSNVKSQQSTISVWDCCAASGGKSIMAKDILRNIDLTVSDIRDSILVNLKKRFKEAGIKNYKTFVADLTADVKLQVPNYDLIICDAPCTGSGTWSRTPEQLFYFGESRIADYASLQEKIVCNAAKYLQPGGYFLYITCSVFRKENEAIANFIKEKVSLNLIRAEVFKGYDVKADTMFAALLRKAL